MKKAIHDYKEMTEFCRYFEQQRPSLFRIAGITPEVFASEEPVSAEVLKDIHMPVKDREAFYTYLAYKEQIYLLLHGIDTIPEERTKQVAADLILSGCSREEVMEKYGISLSTVIRDKRSAVNHIGIDVDEYMKWKVKQLYI